MNQRKIEGAEAPVRHDFDQAAVADELRLHDRWQVADAAFGEQRRGKAGKVVHRQVGLKCEGLLVLSVDTDESPAAFRPAVREDNQPVAQADPAAFRAA